MAEDEKTGVSDRETPEEKPDETVVSGIDNEKDIISDNPRKAQVAVLSTALIISICGISYELLSATISSYFLGNAVMQYSLTIGIFLFAMGIGAYLSKKFEVNLMESFIAIQIVIGLLGGFSTLILFTAYTFTHAFLPVMYGFLLVMGALIGLEVPLLIRILKSYQSVRFSIADVLSFDYVGALVASILFPLFVLPHLGMMHGAFFYALLNMAVVFFNLNIFHRLIKKSVLFAWVAGLVTVILLLGLFTSGRMVTFFESRLYTDEIILARQTKYQRIILTRFNDDLRLYLDGGIQFSSWDEYRYHEVLVHPAMSLASSREEVIILGGGDGLAAREVLKYKDVKRVTLVDIDSEMVELCKNDPFISELNENSLKNPKMNVVIDDAFNYMEKSKERFGVIIVDLPDPKNEGISKLYTESFYQILKNHLARGGIISVQSTSPYFSREVFWCVYNTIESAGLETLPLHAFVPSMGDWGFTLASDLKIDPRRVEINVPTKFLKPGNPDFLFYFPLDAGKIDTEINTLNTHKVLEYYEKAWKMWE